MTKEEFADSTDVRQHIIRGLSWQLAKWRAEGEDNRNVLLGALGDPYPLNADTSVTREAIQMIHEYGHRVTIVTKNPEPRDFDILKERDTYGIKLCIERSWAKSVEPLAPDVYTRLSLLYDAEMKSKCRTMIVIDPFVDQRFTENVIRHTAVGRYVVVEARSGVPVRGLVDWDRLRQLADSLGRDLVTVRTWVPEVVKV